MDWQLPNFFLSVLENPFWYIFACYIHVCSSYYFSQIEGAFIQGLGWVALEELKWGDGAHKWIPPGCLLTCGPGAYKIPSINDVPLKFNVSLLKVYSWILNCFLVLFFWGKLIGDTWNIDEMVTTYKINNIDELHRVLIAYVIISQIPWKILKIFS